MSVFVDLEKRLKGDFHLKVAFEAENEILALLGASGCGKSMTLRCIAGIVRPDRGRIVLNGRTLFDSERHIDLPPQQRGVGYLFQQYALFPHMTVEKNVCAGTREGTRAERKAAVQRILRTLGLEELAQRLPANLSGGQQQRAALARILVGKPEILLLDEPFSALDEHIKWKIELELADTLRAVRIAQPRRDLSPVRHGLRAERGQIRPEDNGRGAVPRTADRGRGTHLGLQEYLARRGQRRRHALLCGLGRFAQNRAAAARKYGICRYPCALFHPQRHGKPDHLYGRARHSEPVFRRVYAENAGRGAAAHGERKSGSTAYRRHDHPAYRAGGCYAADGVRIK